MAAAIVGSLATAGLGVAAFSAAAPVPEGAQDVQSACDSLAGPANDAAIAVSKIHDIGPTIAPALPHPDNPELETGQVNMIQLFLQSRDISGSLRHASGGLRAAEGGVEADDLRSAADDLAQADDDTAAAFDSASNILGPRPPMDEAAQQIMQHLGDAMNAFHHFNDLYSARCGVDLRPDWDNPSAAAAEVDQAAAPEDDQAPAPEDDQAPAPEDDQAPAPADDQAAAPEDDQAPAPADDAAPAPEDDGGQ
ncbi:hypothetical protein HMPREF9336_02728 [Segniliparus rugosus ATCC BAA-974]|uniref:Uncharacterized protein n=2 Tax=Segniliparus rugosus TaxID=286804 RepID=E5XTA6_SEGRC|nr:hypothetical protein HMPREF9336_02728 [Segniliparus rugosus ATCC BAA-974]